MVLVRFREGAEMYCVGATEGQAHSSMAGPLRRVQVCRQSLGPLPAPKRGISQLAARLSFCRSSREGGEDRDVWPQEAQLLP